MNLNKLIVQLGDDFSPQKLPPVKQWNPPLSGELDLVIQRDGRWIHEGEQIKRQSLVNLFASILRKEGEDYFLVSPVEKWKITVDDAPFQVIDFRVVDTEGKQVMVFKTATNDSVILSRENPLRVESDPDSGEPSPYLLVRDGMEGRLNRNTFYQLVEQAKQNKSGNFVVASCGEEFRIG